MSIFNQIFGKFAEIKLQTWSLILGLVAGAFLISRIFLLKRKITTKKLVYGSLCISISFVLSYIRLYHMPQGGTVTPASMLPLIFFAFMFGPMEGILAGIVYGFLQYVQDPVFVHWAQFLFDYPLAFGALGLAGHFKKNFHTGIIAAGLGRFFFNTLSGIIFFASYAPEGVSPILYSITYNGSVVGPDIAICLIVASIPQFRNALNKIRLGIPQ